MYQAYVCILFCFIYGIVMTGVEGLWPPTVAQSCHEVVTKVHVDNDVCSVVRQDRLPCFAFVSYSYSNYT